MEGEGGCEERGAATMWLFHDCFERKKEVSADGKLGHDVFIYGDFPSSSNQVHMKRSDQTCGGESEKTKEE